MGSDDALTKVKDPIIAGVRWVKGRSPQQKIGLSVLAGVAFLFFLWKTISDHDTLFILAEGSHFLGIGILAYKLLQKRSATGVSLESQFLTGIFLSVRLVCSFMMEYDLHTVLDGLTLLATVLVVACMMGHSQIKQSYQKEQDKAKWYLVVIPCLFMAFIAHPQTNHWFLFKIMWAFCVYLESVSVFPQLRMMQKAKVVERFTAHYVFMLGISRFFSCAHWVLQILEGNRGLLAALGSGLWPIMVLASEGVQTTILAGFCYHYIKSYTDGTGVVRLPQGIV